MKFTALSKLEIVSLRLEVATHRLKQLEAEFIQVEEAVEQCMMGDPTEDHTAQQLKTLQQNKETIESVHKKYSQRIKDLEIEKEAMVPATPPVEASSNGEHSDPALVG